ncbi:TPA: hypothetical protein ACGZ99_003556 [Elizabethkingia anophelis]
MKEKQQESPCSLRAPYVPPKMQVIIVEMECGIAANSVMVTPKTDEGSVKTEWDNEVDTEITVPL